MPERGIVKFFNNRTGWGFISRSAAPDVYVHYDQISGEGYRTLQAGEWVEFRVRSCARGPYASDVVRLDTPGTASQADAATQAKAS